MGKANERVRASECARGSPPRKNDDSTELLSEVRPMSEDTPNVAQIVENRFGLGLGIYLGKLRNRPFSTNSDQPRQPPPNRNLQSPGDRSLPNPDVRDALFELH